MNDATPLTSSDATATDRRILDLLLVVMMIRYSLLRKEGADDDDAREIVVGQEQQMTEREDIAINTRGNQSAVSMELLVVTQRLLDAQLRLLDGGEKGRVEVSSSASDQQLMDGAAAAEKKAAAAKKKRKRNKRNKAAAKRKGGAKIGSLLGGGIISLVMMAALIVSLLLIHQSDGSSVGKAPPSLPPSTSLRQRDFQSSVSSTSPSSNIPLSVVVHAPVFSPATASNRRMDSDGRASTCLDKPNWKDFFGKDCDWYQRIDNPGCPHYGSLNEGNMGVANDNCCYCGGGSHTLPPTTSSTVTNSPTKSSTPSSFPSSAPSMCTDTPGWYDAYGYDCVWYEVMDVPGCPQFGDRPGHFHLGVANDNCCHCQNAVVHTVSPTKAPSSSGTCADTPGWEMPGKCEWYQRFDDPGCALYGNDPEFAEEMGLAGDHCCYCKDPTCADFKWKCQYYTTLPNSWTYYPDRVLSVCDTAGSCSCGVAAGPVKIVSNHKPNQSQSSKETVGLYNECKCDLWLRLCEGTRGGIACDYAAEYCCGDYGHYVYTYSADPDSFRYLNSPMCYCDFSKYTENEFRHIFKPKASRISKEFSNPCSQFIWKSKIDEQKSLEAIYERTNGYNWTNNMGWMNETVDHCQWHGISCDVEWFVTSIDLRDNNLVGLFPVYTRNVTSTGYPILRNDWMQSKYGLANLYKLKTLDLADNKLTGTIEYAPLYNLPALTHFDVSGNQLSGEVEALVAASLTHVDFSNNSFTSMRRFETYKVSPLQTQRYCDVSNNVIQEDATDLLENIPPNIEHFIASNNGIYGSLPASLNDLRKLRQFNMASNALSGELPGFTESFATLQELDVSNQANGFTGRIPDNVWRSLSLKILNLAGNKLVGTIPSLVGNLAVLEVFDLSNNFVDSLIPPELGMLQGSLKRLGLSNNTFSGIIPSQIGQLQGASVFLIDNVFDTKTTAPLSLCLEREVKEFDLADDKTFCPIERNALNDFYDSTKGVEWTDGSLWLDEYVSFCNWKGVTCDNVKDHVTKLNLTNNGLSGSLSWSIGNLTFIEELDLSDNDIKGSIPNEIGLLSNLTYLRLSYNAFTGAVPVDLGEMKGLQLIQLQSNRITEMPNIPRLDSIHGRSTFVTDCGVPSAFDKALECENCTMCCNANDDCYPQEETRFEKMGLNYGTFAALAFACFVLLSLWWMVVLLWCMVVETSVIEDDKYALSKIGKNSVYSYFVTDNVLGWLAALATLVIQVWILVFFIQASEANLQDDKIDIQFTWKCPRDTDVCKDKAQLTWAGWLIFCVLMIASLAKDFIGGSKLIYHSTKIKHFVGGMCLCSITLFALYVSAIYNKDLARSNTELIVNSVIILFVMDLDEWIFSLLTAVNEKWTAHAEDDTIDTMKKEIADHKVEMEKKIEDLKAEMKKEIEAEMEKKFADHKAGMEKEIADHEAEIKVIALHQAQIASQQKQEELRKLCELYKNLL